MQEKNTKRIKNDWHWKKRSKTGDYTRDQFCFVGLIKIQNETQKNVISILPKAIVPEAPEVVVPENEDYIEEDFEMTLINYQNTKYYATDITNGTIFAITENYECGEEVGMIANGVITIN